jgi:type II secretory pathway predicted ATPase ExeA/outer membrane protein OmpA-like peptidoglycan-associated protein
MYLKHYDLKSRPFSISPDPTFLWLGEKHAEALAGLEYGILENKGFVLLTGEIGAGKTLLINSLVKSINEEVIVAIISDPRLELIDFYNLLAKKFKLDRKFDRKGDFLIHFEDFLIKADEHNKKVLLIIDEAQRLKSELLDEIRVLSNIEFETRKLINIFFVGQRELKEMLLEERNRPLKQRITYNYHLIPLVEQETAAFIDHRLKVAGGSKKIFSEEAIREIHNFAQGVPRLINIICDHSLVTGYSKSITEIDVDVINECAKELQIAVDKSLPPPEKPTAMEDVPIVQEQEIIKYLQKPKSSKKPLIVQETNKYLQRFKLTDQLSILKVAGIVAIIIISGMVISFFFNSRYEHSNNQLNQKNEILNSEDAEKISKPPLMIAKSMGDTQDTLTDKFSSDGVEIDKNNEEIIIPQQQTVNELEESEINFVSENDLEKPAVENVQVIPVESEKTDEDTKEILPYELSEHKVQGENINKGIITPKDQANIEIGEAKKNTALKNETPEADLQGRETTEGRKLNGNDPKNSAVKEIDQRSKSKENEKFLIYFKLNSADLDNRAFEKINNIAKIVSKNPDLDIIIEGYTDSYGDENFNKKLSQFRSNIIEAYFVAKGIDSSRIKAIGLGSDKPIGDNKTWEGRQENRRVEIKINTKSNDDSLI